MEMVDIQADIEELLSKYTNIVGEITEHRYDEEDNEIHFEDELNTYFEEQKISYQYKTEDAYSSCGYDCTVGAIAWVENGHVQLMTVLFEYY